MNLCVLVENFETVSQIQDTFTLAIEKLGLYNDAQLCWFTILHFQTESQQGFVENIHLFWWKVVFTRYFIFGIVSDKQPAAASYICGRCGYNIFSFHWFSKATYVGERTWILERSEPTANLLVCKAIHDDGIRIQGTLYLEMKSKHFDALPLFVVVLFQ